MIEAELVVTIRPPVPAATMPPNDLICSRYGGEAGASRQWSGKRMRLEWLCSLDLPGAGTVARITLAFMKPAPADLPEQQCLGLEIQRLPVKWTRYSLPGKARAHLRQTIFDVIGFNSLRTVFSHPGGELILTGNTSPMVFGNFRFRQHHITFDYDLLMELGPEEAQSGGGILCQLSTLAAAVVDEEQWAHILDSQDRHRTDRWTPHEVCRGESGSVGCQKLALVCLGIQLLESFDSHAIEFIVVRHLWACSSHPCH